MEGLDSFKGAMIWFTGVVEDASDPLELGRYRVRCYGYHTENKEDLPTQDLPWASVVMPVTSASISGVGESATGLVPGSWVVGFFRDGKSAQDPMILGSIPSRTPAGNDNIGFSDPYKFNPRNPNDDDMPRPATSEFADTSFLTARKELRQEKIETAVPPKMTSILEDKGDTYYQRGTWNNLDPEKETLPIYPYNHVREYSCGHIFEVDETPKHERISQMHKSGTFEEIGVAGDKTVTVVGNDFEVTLKDKNVYVRGHCNLTVDGDVRQLIKGNYHLEVEKDFTVNVKGSMHRKIGQHDLQTVGQEKNINITKDYTNRIGGIEERFTWGDSKKVCYSNNNLIVKGNDTLGVNGTLSVFSKGNLVHGTASQYTAAASQPILIQTDASMQITAATTITEKGPSGIYMN